MSQGNTILYDPFFRGDVQTATNASNILDERFALNLKRWLNQKRIKKATSGINFFDRNKAINTIHQLILKNPGWFYQEKVSNKSSWETSKTYYDKISTSYGRKY